MTLPNKVALIVIGGGITGLSTALTWAKNNPADQRPVLLIEKQPAVGGYVTSFKRNHFLFDTVQLIPDSSDVLNYLGIDIQLKKFTGYYARIFLADPGSGAVSCINIPSGIKNFRRFLHERFPHQRRQLEQFFAYSLSMFDELYHLKVEPNFAEIMRIMLKCPKIIAQGNKTFKQYIDRFGFTDPEIMEILDVFAAFSGSPAERVSALLPVSAMLTSLKGSYRPHKGFIELPLRMRQQLLQLGGIIMNRSKVVKILTKNESAIGVQIENGEKYYADHIVTTIDPKIAMQKLIDPGLVAKQSPKYAQKVKNMKMSASALMINLGLDEHIDLRSMGFDCGYNLLTTGKGIYNRLHQAFDQGELLMDERQFFVPVICSSLTTGSRCSLSMMAYPAPLADWPQLRERDYDLYTSKKQKIAGFYVSIVEKYMIPGLRRHILYMDIASPATFARYSGSPTGSKFDMAPYPENFGKNRLRMRTPIKNLYQPKFSHGIWPCLQAGLQVVDMIMDRQIMNGNSRYRAGN